MVFVFSYDRKEMLESIVGTLRDEDVYIMDDGSKFTIPNTKTIKLAHGGKSRFWEKWVIAFKIAEGSDDDLFVFMPDDFLNVDMKRIRHMHGKFAGKPYVHHIINDGRESCWNPKKQERVNPELFRCYFVDCAFFCSRAALRAIAWNMPQVTQGGFKNIDGIGSGVGKMLTALFNSRGVPIYKPLKSMAFHGTHPSKMHPNHRVKKPLVSL